uniref:Uncharacterized protein n=1 Tax=Anopheles minimus TaxID=112268 RepID=A0A182VXK4_9DIPT
MPARPRHWSSPFRSRVPLVAKNANISSPLNVSSGWALDGTRGYPIHRILRRYRIDPQQTGFHRQPLSVTVRLDPIRPLPMKMDESRQRCSPESQTAGRTI